MSNLLNSFYSNLNDLISINATDITTDTLTSNSINTTTLKVNGTNINNLFDVSFNSLQSQITTNTNNIITNTNNITTNTNNITTNTNNINTNTSDISGNKTDINNIKTTLTNVSYNSSTGAFQIGGTTDCRILNTLYLYNGSVPYSLNIFVSDTNTNIVSLVNKTTNMSFSSTTTNFSGTLGSDIFTINTSINGTSKAKFNNIMNTCFDISGNCQAQIDGAYTAAAGAATAAAGALTAANTFTTDAIATYATAQVLVDAGQDTAIDTLETKTQTYTYDVTNNIVAIASRLNANSFGDINFTGDLSQTYQANKNNTFRNPTYFQHNVELQNNKGFLIDAGSTFENNGITNINNTLNVNAFSNFYSNVKIRDNTTTNSGTILPYLNVCSISTNTNARKLQGISIGVEQVLNNQSNCNVGYNYVSDGSTSNYGYLGLNTNTLNTIESFRWFLGGCAVPVGDLTIASGNTTITLGNLQLSTGNLNIFSGAVNTNTINNYNNNLALNSTGNYNLQLNSKLINIGTNQGIAVPNVVNIGATLSPTTINLNGIINLNGVVNMSLGLQMYNVGDIISQFV